MYNTWTISEVIALLFYNYNTAYLHIVTGFSYSDTTRLVLQLANTIVFVIITMADIIDNMFTVEEEFICVCLITWNYVC